MSGHDDLEWITKAGADGRWRTYGVAVSGQTVLQTTASYATKSEAVEAVRGVSEATERAERAERLLKRNGVMTTVATVILLSGIGFQLATL